FRRVLFRSHRRVVRAGGGGGAAGGFCGPGGFGGRRAAARRRAGIPVEDLQRRVDGGLRVPGVGQCRAEDRRGARAQAQRAAGVRARAPGGDGGGGDQHPARVQRVAASGDEGG